MAIINPDPWRFEGGKWRGQKAKYESTPGKYLLDVASGLRTSETDPYWMAQGLQSGELREVSYKPPAFSSWKGGVRQPDVYTMREPQGPGTVATWGSQPRQPVTAAPSPQIPSAWQPPPPPQQPPPQPPAQEITITDPGTGETFVWRNGQWVKTGQRATTGISPAAPMAAWQAGAPQGPTDMSDLSDATKVPGRPLPTGYRWQWTPRYDEITTTDPITGEKRVEITDKGKWLIAQVDTGALTDYESARLQAEQAQMIQVTDPTTGQPMTVSANAWLNFNAQAAEAAIQRNFDEAQAQLQREAANYRAALESGDRAKQLQAQQSYQDAQNKLEQARIELQKTQQDIASGQWGKEFQESQRRWEQGQTVQAGQFQQTLDFQKQQAAATTLLELGRQAQAQKEREAAMAANPRDWIQYALATKGTLPGSTAWLSKLTGLQEGRPIERAPITPPSAMAWGEMPPTEKRMLEGYASWLGIPWEDLMQKWSKFMPQWTAPPPAQWEPVYQR